MQPIRVALCEPAAPGVPDDDARALPATPRDPAAILAEVAPLPAGAWVILGGPTPLAHPGFFDLARDVTARGLRVKLRAAGALPDPQALRAVGVELVQLTVHSADADAHDAITGQPGSWADAMEAWRRADAGHLHVEVHARLEAPNATGLPSLIQQAAARRAPVFVTWAPGSSPLTRDAALAAAEEAAIEADRVGGRLEVTGLVGPPSTQPPLPDPLPVGENVGRLLTAGTPLPRAQAGLIVGDRLPPERALAWAAAGWPALDRPPIEGGTGEHTGAPPPIWAPSGPRVALVLPAISDNTLVLSGFPGLFRALVRLGADVRWWSAWGPPADTIPPTMGPRRREEVARATAAEAALLDALDLSSCDLVVVPGWGAAAKILRHPSLRPDTRLVIADFHLLSEIDAWRAATQDRWPEQAVVHACFPGYAHLYVRKNVPLDRILWRPYPIDRATLPPGPPAAAQVRAFAGGNQRREWALLLEAGRRLQRAQLDLYTRDQPTRALPPSLAWRGTADLLPFYQAIADARFVVLPLRWDRDVASGLTVAAMALAAGRPVVSTITPGTRDHLRADVDSLMVPPQRPDLLAAAIDRLAADDALVTRLSEGAAQAAQALSVDRWAEQLIRGGAQSRVFPAPGRPAPPWYPW